MTGGPTGSRSGSRVGPVAAALGLDVAWLLVFVVLGRTSHREGETMAGLARTLWPFLAGLAVGWVVARAWRRPTAIGTGLVVWPVTVAAAMVLRALAGQGTAPAFIGVALAFVGLGLMGWRSLASAATRRRS